MIDFEANMADASFECSLDLGPFEPCVPPVTYTNLIIGDHNLRVLATGNAPGGGELSQEEASEYEWSVEAPLDNAPPDTLFDRMPRNNSADTIFEFHGVDDVTPTSLLTYECRIYPIEETPNDTMWEGCGEPPHTGKFNLLEVYTYEMAEMAPGLKVFEVRAIDDTEPVDPGAPQEGNVDLSPARYEWTMVADTEPPGTGIVTGPANNSKVGLTEAEFQFFGGDNATPVLELTYECSIDGAPFEPCDTPHSTGTLEPGTHTFRVRAIDLALNVDPTPDIRTWTIVPMPITTITSGPGQPSEFDPEILISDSESAVFVFHSSQQNSTFECALDEGGSNPLDVEPFVPCTSPRAYWGLQDGEHKFAVRATNPEGVIEEPAQVYEWVVELGPDNEPPTVSITSTPEAVTILDEAVFGFTGSDNRVAPITFQCAINGFAWNSCVSPQQFSDFTRGLHTFRVRSRDGAGNFSQPVEHTWRVDLPPLAVLTVT
ncbi:MAG TPA: hypothetical protein VGZ51_09110, partial [Actinomycetota bacterium]|nr:hypothetical protein [Actinomycetota bacterium]